jgi:hypothetical protein
MSGELQATKAVWCRRLMKEMRVWRNGVMLIKGENRTTCFKNLERTIFLKSFYFQLHTAKNEIQTPELLTAALYVDRNPLFPFVWTF